MSKQISLVNNVLCKICRQNTTCHTKIGFWVFNPKTGWVMEQRQQKKHYQTHIRNGCEKHKKATIQYYAVNPTTGNVSVQND